jgi:hypothetical protein
MNWRDLIAPCAKARSVGRRILPMLIVGLFLAAGCNEETTQPEDDSLVLPALTSPENVISAIQVIYNDKTHSKEERLAAYASLFDSAFVFSFQINDIGGSTSWGLEGELAAHDGMFGAQAAGNIYSLDLRVTHDPAEDLSPPESGREGWKEVFATNVYLRLMFNLEDGLEVNGAQTEFKFPPAENGQFKIGDWIDLPRPGPMGPLTVEPTTWGAIKALYN